MGLQLIIDGHYVSALTSWGDLDWSLTWPGYSDELTFDVASHPSIFKPGKIGSLVWAGERLFTGTLDEPVRGQKLRLAGLHRLAENYIAIDGVGAPTLQPFLAVDQAIARGFPVTRPSGFGGAVPLKTDTPNTVAQIIDSALSAFPGEGWGVTPDQQIIRAARPAVRHHVRPGGDGLGIAWDNYASSLFARYVDSTTHAYTTVAYTDAAAANRWGYKEAVLTDALNDGAEMTTAQAVAILQSKLAAGRARPGWTQAIEVQYGAVLNDYQQPVDLASLKPWEIIRVHGLTDDVGDLPGQSYVDMPLSRINHNPKTGTAVLTPMGLLDPMGDVLSGKTAA